jgi:hypothetical protein
MSALPVRRTSPAGAGKSVLCQRETITRIRGIEQFRRPMIYLTFGISGLFVSGDDATFDAAENIVHASFHLNQLKALNAFCKGGQEGADFETR